MRSGAGTDQPRDGPVTPELLADLQAGLLDDATAARLRHRVRTDPGVARRLAELESVRREVARLGTHPESAPDVPTELTARIGAALRDASARRRPPAHAVPRSTRRRPPVQLLVAGVGAAAAVLAATVGAAALVREPAPTRPAGPTAELITVSRPPRNIPLSDAQVLGLLARSPDLGPLADPQRRASCLSGLGYPAATPVLGARMVDVDGRPAVLLLLAADTPHAVVALVVRPTCSSADTGLLADTVVSHP